MIDPLSRLDLISREELKDAISNNPLIDFTDDDIFKIIDGLDPVLAIRQGEWIHSETEKYHVICSVCNYKSIIWNAKFCPNCGADMKGENNG